jgi:hypothetical protein
VSNGGIAGQVQTRPAVRHVGSADNRSRIAWAAVMRTGIGKFSSASSPADHQAYRHPFTDRYLLPGPGFGERLTGYRYETFVDVRR